MIERHIEKRLIDRIKPAFVLGLFGARRTGKTYLMQQIITKMKGEKILLVQGDNIDASEILSSRRLSLLQSFVSGYNYLFIDEAQFIPNIGQSLKLMVDNIPDLSIFITGSSAIDLKNKIGEPLTGRSNYQYLFPFAQSELNLDFIGFKTNLENLLIYGSYPQVFLAESNEKKIEILNSIKNGYLLKDILAIDNQKDSIFVFNLLRLIAFQIGNNISYNELASNLNVNRKTVQRYLDILEKAFIIFSLPAFSRNIRKEYAKTPRYYFWDNGIRNSLISNFNNITTRDDIGKLWENYCVSEKLKISKYNQKSANYFYWRTYDQQEIDLIEETGGQLNAFEFKWNARKEPRMPKAFERAYTNSHFQGINPNNFIDFIKQ